jgi:hypothetical protein
MVVAALLVLRLLSTIGDPSLPGPIDLADEEFPQEPRAEPAPEYTARLSPAVRWVTGTVKVREKQLEGTRLDLPQELGLRLLVGANAQVEMETRHLQIFAEVEEMFGSGGTSADQPFAWNGTVYTAPSQIRVHASFLTVRSFAAAKLLVSEEGHSWLGPVAGIEWPYYTVSVGTNLQHGSLEDWVHYLPYPIIGVAGRLRLSDSIDLQGRLVGGYLPNVPTPYTEGGRLYVSVRPSVSLEVPITWRVSPSIELSCTLTYQYWSGTDHSTEDGNQLTISNPGLMLGIAYRW